MSVNSSMVSPSPAALINAAGEGDTIELLTDIVLTEGVTVAAGKTITMDLNGKTITGKPAEAKAFSVITNKGDLTIVGEGSIICDHQMVGSTAYAVNTITNSGTLTIDGAIIENKSTASNQIGYAIDNNSGTGNAIVEIDGGEVKASGSNYYDGIRLFCNSQTNENFVTVGGGTVSSIWLQNPSDGAAGKDMKDVKGAVSITGGEVNALYLEPSAAFQAEIAGGYVGKVEYFTTSEGRDLTGFITGGTFGTDVTEYCAPGYKAEVNVDGTYGVQVGLPEVAITDIKGSLTGEDPDLTFALNFAIPNVEDLTEEYLDQLFEAYGDHYVDYVLTISGLDGDSVTFNANGGADGYLAGQYDAWSESWVTVPFSDVVVNDGESLYIMEYAAKLMGKQGLRFTLAEVAAIVQNFDCGVYFTPEFLAEHPELEVNLQLKVFTEDAEGNKIENIDVATNEFENSYAAAVTAEGKQTVYYATFAEAYDAAQAGETVELLQDVRLTAKLTISKGITIDGNGCSIIADETAVWYTVSGKLNIKNYKTHLLGINADGIVLKDIVLDCNDNAAGINVYCAQNVVFDNVSVINDSKGVAAVTVNGSTLTLKDKFSIEKNGVALDISNGSGVTSTLGVTIEDGTVLDLNSKTVKFASVANNDMTGAVDENGDPYFAAMDNAYYYTQAQIDSRTTGYTNGLTLLTNVILVKDVAISSTLDLNGHDLTVVDGKSLKVEKNLTLTGEGSVDGTIKLTKAAAALTAPAGMENVVSGVDGYKVVYSGGVYMLALENTVAWNTVTGAEYETVSAALLAAQSGETVQLLVDVDEPAAILAVLNGVTLDLNGHTLTAYYVLTASVGAYVTDSTNGQGILKVSKDNLALADNSQAMVWKNEESGYRFTAVTFGTQVKANGEGSARFNFYVKELEGIVLAELADGMDDNDGLSIQIKMTYTNSVGAPSELYFNFPMEEVQKYAANLPGYLYMGIGGLDAVTDVTFSAIVKCGNLLIESAPVSYKG